MKALTPLRFSPLLLAMATAAAAEDSLTLDFTQVGPDSFRFGDYTGLYQSGAYWQAAFAAARSGNYNDRENHYWQVEGERIGLRSAQGSLKFGSVGHYKVALSFEGLPHFRFDGPVETPFLNPGSARLDLPASFSGGTTTKTFGGLQSSFQSATLHSDRQHWRLQAEWRPASEWTVSVDYQRQSKRGLDALGAAFGSNGGNARAVLLTSPVDYDTDNFTIALEQQQGRNSWRVAYQASLFSNANTSVQWANPFNNPQWRAGANFSNKAYGTMAQAPDNTFHSLSLSKVNALGTATTLSFSGSAGRMRQDESLLPYSSVFTSSTPLPMDHLLGDITTYNAAVSLQTRVSAAWSLRLRYTIDGRDNDVQRSLWLRIPNDSAVQATLASDQARVNRPYSHVKQLWDAQATWRLPKSQQLQFGWRLDRKQRDFVDVDTVDEHSASLVWSTPLPLDGRLRMEVQEARRRGSDYVGNNGFLAGHSPEFVSTLAGAALYENDPQLRRFHVADRNRTQWKGSWTQPLANVWTLTLQGNAGTDEFPQSRIGLQEVQSWQTTFTLGYAPSRKLSTWLWWGRQAYQNRQQGYARSGAAPAPIIPDSARLFSSNWWMSTRDSVESAGAGVDWQAQNLPLTVKLEAEYSDAGSEYLPASSGQAWLPFPAIGTRSASFSLSGDYTLKQKHRIGMRYRYVDYHTSDFALDNVAVDTLNNVLLLGNASPIYSGSLIELRFTYVLP